jgi:hypothetical protein
VLPGGGLVTIHLQFQDFLFQVVVLQRLWRRFRLSSPFQYCCYHGSFCEHRAWHYQPFGYQVLPMEVETDGHRGIDADAKLVD